MRSIDTVSKPARRALSPAARACRPLWRRPRKRRVSSEKDCTPRDSVRTPRARHAAQASGVTSSGLASRNTHGAGVSNGRCARHASSTRPSSSGDSCEGVPPPKYTVSNGLGSRHSPAASAASSTRREAKRRRAGDAARITEKSQYGQMAEQKGMCRYSPGLSIVVVVLRLEHGHEGRLRDLHRSHHLHLLLAFLLLLEELALAAYVAAVALGRHVLAEGVDGGPGDDLAADRALDGDLELLARDLLGQPLAIAQRPRARELPVDELGEGIDLFAVDEDVHLHHVSEAVVQHLVVERAVALGDRLQPVVEVEEDLGQGQLARDLHPARGQEAVGGVHPAALAAQLHHR